MKSKRKYRLACFCEGSHNIGLGHFVRTSSLSEAFENAGFDKALFLSNEELEPNLEKSGFEHFLYPEEYTIREKVSSVCNFLEGKNIDVLLIDIKNNIPLEIAKKLKNYVKQVICIDSGYEQRLIADINIYPPIEQVKQLDWKNYKGSILNEWQWVLLKKSITKKNLQEDKVRILITMGSSDPFKVTTKCLTMLKNVDIEAELDIVIGTMFSDEYKKELQIILKEYSLAYKVHENIDNLSDLMNLCSFAIAVYGTTAYELTYLGKPAILFSLNQNDYKSSLLYKNEKIGFPLGSYENIDENYFLSLVKELSSSKSLRKEISENCNKLIDGKGAERIVDFSIKKIEELNE